MDPCAERMGPLCIEYNENIFFFDKRIFILNPFIIFVGIPHAVGAYLACARPAACPSVEPPPE